MERRYVGHGVETPEEWPAGVRRVWAECELEEAQRTRTLERAKDRLRERARGIALLLPPLVIASMALLFRGLAVIGGPRIGYLAAFLFYWGFWGLLVPRLLLGRHAMGRLFGPGRRPLASLGDAGRVLLILPPLVAAFTVFPAGLGRVTVPIVLASLAIATVNATTEEVLWRGVYARLFPDSMWLGYLYPALGFGLWHLAPQLAHPLGGLGAVLGFVVAATLIGLCYGWVAWRTGSVRGTVASHILMDFLGLGALVFLA